MTDLPDAQEAPEQVELLSVERLAEIAEYADKEDNELAFATLEVIQEVLLLRDWLADTQAVLSQFANAIDVMMLVADQADDGRAKRLIDAALIRVGLLDAGESAFAAQAEGR